MAPESDAQEAAKPVEAKPAQAEPTETPPAPSQPATTPGERARRASARLKKAGPQLKSMPKAVEIQPPQDLQAKIDRWLTEADTVQGRIFELTIGVLIIVSCVFYALHESLFVPETIKNILWWLEYGITILFLFEYLTRWWARRFSIRYLFTPLALIDLVAILPLLPLAGHLGFVRVLRLLRILRLLRLLQSRKFFFGEITQEHLLVTRILFTIFALFFITGGLLYEVEHPVNPAFSSIFESLYFAVVTLTTVGFGDLTPVTKIGKGLTMVAVLAGITIIPWQLANLARHMLQEKNKVEVICRFCGLRQHDHDASHCKACGNLIYQEYDGNDDA